MGNKKLIWCCIAGIVLGFLAPLVLKTNQQTSLMIGLVAGLGVGYLLDMMDEKNGAVQNRAVLSKKAREANQLMERARAELENRELPEEDPDEDEETLSDEEEDLTTDLTDEEQSAKLDEAEELLRKARERMNQ